MSEVVGVQIQIGGETKVVQTVGELKKLLKEAQFEALKMSSQFGETSQEALAAAKNVAMLKDQIKDTAERVDLFDPGKKFQAFSNAIQAAGGGIAALQGAMGLFGAESEDVQKTLLKVQSALALSQGLSVISDMAKQFNDLKGFISQSTVFLKANELATKATAGAMRLFGVSVTATSTSFKVLKGAIAATGIGLLVVALGEAVSWMMSFSDATKEAAEAQKQLNEQTLKYANAGLKGEMDFIERNTKLLVAQAKARGENERQIYNIEQDGRRRRIESLTRFYNEVKSADQEAAQDALNQIKNINNEGLIAQANFEESKRNQSKQAAEQAAFEQAQAQQQRLKDEFQREEIAYQKRKSLREKEQKEIQTFGVIKEENDKIQKEKEEEAAKKFEERSEKIIASIGKILDAKTKETLQTIENNKRKEQADRDYVAATIEVQDLKVQALRAGAGFLQTLAGENEALANTFFLVDKALAIGKIVVDTQREIAGYYAANAGIPVVGVALASKLALAAKIRAGIGIASIAGATIAKFKGGGGQSLGVGGISSQAPLVPESTVAANQVTLDQRSINALGNQAIRAYVVENDITRSQQRIRRIERSTRFG